MNIEIKVQLRMCCQHGAALYPSVGPLCPGLVLLHLLPVANEDALSFLALLVKQTLLLLQLSLPGTVKVM